MDARAQGCMMHARPHLAHPCARAAVPCKSVRACVRVCPHVCDCVIASCALVFAVLHVARR
eukprot:2570610-Alexandrium_andersonii.AAC.1